MLLRGVGGKGQEKLIAAAAVAFGEGLAIETAVAYLRAGGTPVEWQGVAHGFLLPRAVEPGTSAAVARASTLHQTGSSFTVVLGGRDGSAFVQATECHDCVAAALAAVGPVPEEQAVFAGALAALVYQRYVIGLGTSPHPALRATFSRWEKDRVACEAHR